jgi:menaquinone-9 beta-reductase
VETFDAIVIGGGPAGSTCAEVLGRGGARVAVLDRARFPRVKLCAGWLSAPVWEVLQLSPGAYPRGLWEWDRCHVHFGGRHHEVAARGWFIRRYEFDDFLLTRSGAQVIEASAKRFGRDEHGYWVVDETWRARHLVGAGGTHCPVARALFPAKDRDPVGVQEREFEADADAIAASRLGDDGEPELLLHGDLRGYSWNVPKSGWLNIGCGTVDARQVRDAWAEARRFFADSGHVPPVALPELERVKGHSYYLFDPAHLIGCERDGAFLVGDALGLAQPLTAEGILPAILSGRLCAEAILDGDAPSYQRRLQEHPILQDYELLYRLREAGSSLKRGAGAAAPRLPLVRDLSRSATAHGFAWLFSGKRVPAGRTLGRLVSAAQTMTRRS